jgi:hypothetical protein
MLVIPMRRHVAALALMALCCGCSSIKDLFSSSTPSSSTGNSTQSFTGTVSVGGSSFFTFTVTQAGKVNVTLTTLGGTSPVGLGIGTPNGSTSCQVTTSSQSTTAGSSPQVSATETAGTYCVSVFDAGALAASTTFSVTIDHP